MAWTHHVRSQRVVQHLHSTVCRSACRYLHCTPAYHTSDKAVQPVQCNGIIYRAPSNYTVAICADGSDIEYIDTAVHHGAMTWWPTIIQSTQVLPWQQSNQSTLHSNTQQSVPTRGGHFGMPLSVLRVRLMLVLSVCVADWCLYVYRSCECSDAYIHQCKQYEHCLWLQRCDTRYHRQLYISSTQSHGVYGQ